MSSSETRPSTASGRTVLKRNVKRTVSLESCENGARVVKRFHAPSAFDRLLDGRRARREQRSLARVRDAGLRAPRPIEVRKRDGHWELVTEFVEGATVRDMMHAGGPWPGGAGRVARRLGRELARAFVRGIDHSDLHPGNVLLDREGRPWWIDAAHCRLGAVPSAARMRAVLIALAAGTREHLEPLARGLFLSAFLRALDPERAHELGARPSLARELENAARVQRRVTLEQRAARWVRESSAVTEFHEGGVRGFVRRDAPEVEPARVITTVEDAAAAWLGAARLTMHGVPCARPLRLTQGAPVAASFELALPPTPCASSEELSSRAWRALGATLGALHDRALTWNAVTPDTILIETSVPCALWLPALRPRPLDTAPESRRRELLEVAQDLSPPARARAAFLIGYLAAQRHSAQERALLREELVRG